jgi:hypothetical protein
MGVVMAVVGGNRGDSGDSISSNGKGILCVLQDCQGRRSIVSRVRDPSRVRWWWWCIVDRVAFLDVEPLSPGHTV